MEEEEEVHVKGSNGAFLTCSWANLSLCSSIVFLSLRAPTSSASTAKLSARALVKSSNEFGLLLLSSS